MKNILLPLCLLFVVLLSCATANKAHQALSGNWQLSLFTGGDKSFAETFGQRRPQISFNASQKQVSGTTGCNRFFGPYTLNNNQLSFGSNLGLTKMACPDYDEQVFLTALQQVTNYRITNNQLELLAGDAVLMTFTRQ